MQVIKRDGRVVEYDRWRIFNAIKKAWIRTEGEVPDGDLVWQIIDDVERSLSQFPTVKQIQDAVEERLSLDNFQVAKAYILYREQQKNEREREEQAVVQVASTDGDVSLSWYTQTFYDYLDFVPQNDREDIVDEWISGVYGGISYADVLRLRTLVLRSRIERDPQYRFYAAKSLLDEININTLPDLKMLISQGVILDIYDHRMLNVFDFEQLQAAIQPKRDELFAYLGLQTLYDRYLLKVGPYVESPAQFWMRVAMGLALNEDDPTQRAIEFYDALSSFRMCSSTPTLFNSGTTHPQLSSCYLSTTPDDLGGIFKIYGDNAQLSKWSGGLGVDFTNVRAMGADIKGTRGKSNGVVPFLKILNDTVAAVDQGGGRRRGSGCVYLEPWHLDIEAFLDLRKNTGDERLRAHDLNTAVWVPDLFMERVRDRGHWTLFTPDQVPDLHDLYGEDFRTAYEHYEYRAQAEGGWRTKTVEAVDLWRKILGSLFETGHPWITFKDPSNIRYSNQHVGVVHSSNLCSEILLLTNSKEIAVCNLASINLPNHLREDGDFDGITLSRTVRTAMRMLDNVIDLNFYPVEEARYSNLRHRPVGLGVMGFQDVLEKMGASYASSKAVTVAGQIQEFIAYHAIMASSRLAKERGIYETYEGSLWSRGLFPQDTVKLLADDRGWDMELPRETLDWSYVREHVAQWGMRNSNTMAIAPTATISNIQGVTQSIEPNYSNLFVKSNLSGEFTMINANLVSDLQELGLWDDDMLSQVKFWDGSVAMIEDIPLEIRERYPTVFEVAPEWLIACAQRRQWWLDQAQSLNLYIDQPSGSRLDDIYMEAWKVGLKTTYYLRSRGASQIEKSTVDINKHGNQSRSFLPVLQKTNVTIVEEDGCLFCE